MPLQIPGQMGARLTQTLDSFTMAKSPSSESKGTTNKAIKDRIWQHSLVVSKL